MCICFDIRMHIFFLLYDYFHASDRATIGFSLCTVQCCKQFLLRETLPYLPAFPRTVTVLCPVAPCVTFQHSPYVSSTTHPGPSKRRYNEWPNNSGQFVEINTVASMIRAYAWQRKNGSVNDLKSTGAKW